MVSDIGQLDTSNEHKRVVSELTLLLFFRQGSSFIIMVILSSCICTMIMIFADLVLGCVGPARHCHPPPSRLNSHSFLCTNVLQFHQFRLSNKHPKSKKGTCDNFSAQRYWRKNRSSAGREKFRKGDFSLGAFS